jgi:Extensin-like protein C-terminus
MARGVSWYLVGSFVLVSLAGCGRGFFFEEREPWRGEAEVACLKSGAVREGPDIVRISPISGPGACGADFPLKVSAIGEGSSTFGFADEDLRPPAAIGNQPRWPAGQPPAPPPPSSYYRQQPYAAPNSAGGTGYGASDDGTPSGPVSLRAPGVAPDQDGIRLPSEGAPPGWQVGSSSPYAPPAAYPRDNSPYPRENYAAPSQAPASPPPYSSYPAYQQPSYQPPPRLGPGPMQGVVAGPVEVRPPATLACPIVSVLDRWFTDTVQPAAQRWFGSRVVEIKQISAYSCRGMNGNPNAHISEHAFGNALDIAAFTFADGRRVTVKDGWHGLPEEQGFLRDVEAGACQQFTTVLAPGSNAYHYDHIHVDLMRRASRRLICEPAAVSGEEVAARAMQRNPYASREPPVTGSLGKTASSRKHRAKVDEEDEFEDE